MTMPTGLFIESPEMSDSSLHRLNQDDNSWAEEIIQKLKERAPKIQGKSTLVKFMKKDPENGVATGSVLITSAEKAVIVPVIIKDFMLFPLDVMIAESKLLPLTPEYLASIFDNNSVFQTLEEYPTFGGLGRFEDANLWNITYPPSLGRYAYASAGYPLLDLISSTIDGSSLKQYLQETPLVAANFYKKGHAFDTELDAVPAF